MKVKLGQPWPAMRNAILVSALLLAACAKDPASEPPVALQPGDYEVQVGGGTLVSLADHQTKGRVCLAEDAAADFPENPLGHLIEDWDGCSDSVDEPRGNAFSGKRECDQSDRRHTPVLVRFTGSHGADSFELRGAVTQGSDEGGGVMRLGSGDFSVSGQRVGACPA